MTNLAITKQTPQHLKAIWDRAIDNPKGIRVAVSGSTAEHQHKRAQYLRRLLYVWRKREGEQIAKELKLVGMNNPYGHLSILIKDPFDGFLYITPADFQITAIDDLDESLDEIKQKGLTP